MKKPELKRFVVVIGPTGAGKSTLSNMLFNDDTTPDACTSPFPVGGTTDSVTKQAAIQVNLTRGMCVLDTIGIGDPQLDEVHIKRAIRGLIRDTVAGVHAIVAVMRMGRVSSADRVNLHLLQELFHAGDLKTHGALMVTHWEGDLGDEDKDVAAWVGDDKEMKSITSAFAKVFLANNCLKGRFADPRCRAARLQELRELIDSNTLPILPKAIDVADFVKQLMRKFVRFFVPRPVVYLEQLATWVGNQEYAFPTWCGDCAVCSEPINIIALCTLPCEHSFHKECVQQLHPPQCPLCRSLFEMECCFSFGALREAPRA